MYLTPMSARRFAALFGVGLVGSLIAMWLLGGDYLDGDGRHYALMAQGGWGQAVQPFANRVLTPAVVAVLKLVKKPQTSLKRKPSKSETS